jgi:hypothetical protein
MFLIRGIEYSYEAVRDWRPNSLHHRSGACGQGRIGWQRMSGYNKQPRIEAAYFIESGAVSMVAHLAVLNSLKRGSRWAGAAVSCMQEC